MKTARNPETIHPPVGSYVHQMEVTGSNRWLTISGQIGMNLDGSVPEEPLEQFELALNNIKRNLEAANMGIQDLTKLVFFLVGDFDTDKRRKIVKDFLGDHIPCTTLLYVVALAASSLRVEIDAWACKEIG
ncbi:RidA family protein [Bacillus haimaensis]|uniref:RidA family protein n=1 Tax=Bacillus haimaensis TaxID=3160967 RepID=UPI003AA95145